MKIEDLYKILEKNVAPVALSDEFCAKYKSYDNSGIIINCGKDISGALFTLDLSEESIKRAEELGFNAVVTHHPAIYGGIERFDLPCDSHARAIAKCLQKGISVISMHLNFDSAPEGIDYYLMKGLGGAQARINSPLEGGGYGRCFDIEEIKFGDYIEKIAAKFKTRRLVAYGDGDKIIRKIASFCGAGCDGSAIAFAREQGAELVVSSDMPHHRITELVENGINVIQLTHYCAETYGLNAIYEKIKKILNTPSSFFADERFM